MNGGTCLCVRKEHVRGISYDLFINGESGAEYSREIGHSDERRLRRIIERLETPKRVRSRSGRNWSAIEDYFESPDEEYRDENTDGILIALPGRDSEDEDNGLRLFALQWGLRTIVLCGMVDKGSWTGAWRRHPDPNVRAIISRYESIGKAIQKQIDLGVLTVNESEFGFAFPDEEGIQLYLPLTEYL